MSGPVSQKSRDEAENQASNEDIGRIFGVGICILGGLVAGLLVGLLTGRYFIAPIIGAVAFGIIGSLMMADQREREIEKLALEIEEKAEAERQRVRAELEEFRAQQEARTEAWRAKAEHERRMREWEQREAVENAAAELAALENKVRVLWADFQATYNFTGEIPENDVRQQFAARHRRQFTGAEQALLARSKSELVKRLLP